MPQPKKQRWPVCTPHRRPQYLPTCPSLACVHACMSTPSIIQNHFVVGRVESYKSGLQSNNKAVGLCFAHSVSSWRIICRRVDNQLEMACTPASTSVRRANICRTIRACVSGQIQTIYMPCHIPAMMIPSPLNTWAITIPGPCMDVVYKIAQIGQKYPDNDPCSCQYRSHSGTC